jgi:hypothetical protein
MKRRIWCRLGGAFFEFIQQMEASSSSACDRRGQTLLLIRERWQNFFGATMH